MLRMLDHKGDYQTYKEIAASNKAPQDMYKVLAEELPL